MNLLLQGLVVIFFVLCFISVMSVIVIAIKKERKIVQNTIKYVFNLYSSRCSCFIITNMRIGHV